MIHAVADDPRRHLGLVGNRLARRPRQNAVKPLARVDVHVAEQLLPVARLGFIA